MHCSALQNLRAVNPSSLFRSVSLALRLCHCHCLCLCQLTRECTLRLDTVVKAPSSSEHAAAPTSPPSSAPDTSTAGARARSVQFATSPRLITVDSAATTAARASRFHCSPIRDSCDPTVVVALPREQASSPAAVLSQYQVDRRDAQQEAVQREEQVAMDKLFAERLAQSENTDQRTLQEQMNQTTGEACHEDVLVIPDGLECPITNELFVDPVMCTDGTAAVAFETVAITMPLDFYLN